MDNLDKRLLNLIQTAFPLESKPFAVMGDTLGIGEDEVIARLSALKNSGIIRQISAIFDSAALGYRGSLVAFSVPSERLQDVAEIVNSHPGVSHNYERNHAYNLWFTITVPPGTTPESEVDRLAERAQPTAYRMFPTIRLFKIGVAFDMTGGGVVAHPSTAAQDGDRDIAARSFGMHSNQPAVRPESVELDEDDIIAVRALQLDLPLVSRPFALLAETVRMDEEELLSRARKFVRQGTMRRYAAVLRHRQAGFAANVMAAWVVPEERIEELAPKMASHPAVSHCYQRPTYPDWPYSIFTMIHGRTERDCENVVREISESTGITDFALLYSTREFKKSRVQYYEHTE